MILLRFFAVLLFFSSSVVVYGQKVALTFFNFNNHGGNSRFDFYKDESEHIEKIKRIMPTNCLRLSIQFRDYTDIRENNNKFRILKDTTIYLVGNEEQNESRFPIDFRNRSEVVNELAVRPTNYAVFGRFLTHLYYEELYGSIPEVTTEKFLMQYEAEILQLKTLENNQFALYTLLVYYCLKEQKDNAQSTLKKMQELFPDKYLFVEAVAFFEKKFDTEFFNTEEKIRRLEKYPEFNLIKASISPEDLPLNTALEARKILDELGGNDFRNFDEKSYLWFKHKQYDSALHYSNLFLNYWENNSDSLLVCLYTFPLNAYTNVADVLCVLKRYDEALVCLKKGDYLRSMPKLNLNINELTANIAYEQIAALSFTGLNKLDTAFAIYEKLVTKWGAEQFVDSLKNLYPLRFPDAKESFEDYYARISGKKVYPNAPISDLNLLRGNEKTQIGGESPYITVLNFWGIFCQPCIKEFPLLNKLSEQYASNPLVRFISVTPDGPEALNRFFQKRRFDYKHAHSAHSAFRLYDINSIPVNLIIDKKGRVVFKHIGYDKDIVEKMSEVLDKLLYLGEY